MITTEELGTLLAAPIPAELRGRPRFPRCPHCGQRPELIEARGAALEVASGFGEQVVRVPRYEVLPCCSARYVRTVEHVTRRQRLNLRATAQAHPNPPVSKET